MSIDIPSPVRQLVETDSLNGKKRELEDDLLEQELDHDAEKNGPMTVIIDAISTALDDWEFWEKYDVYQDNRRNTELARVVFTYQSQKYELVVSLFPGGNQDIFRFSILSADPGRKTRIALIDNPDFPQFGFDPGEVAFRQFMFNIDQKNFGEANVDSITATADDAQPGFAKSLTLASSKIIRLLMDNMGLDHVHASIADRATGAGRQGWSSNMAERLGYDKTSDDIYEYDYDFVD